MYNLLCFDETLLLWYVFRIKKIYDKCGEKVTQCFNNFGIDAEEYEILAAEILENLPQCIYHDYLYVEYEDSDEHNEIDGEKWIFTSDEMREFYSLLVRLRDTGVITESDADAYADDVIDYIKEVIVDKQYCDGGFHCHFDDGTETGEKDCRIEIYRYLGGSFAAFDVVCGIIAVFEKYKEKLKDLKDTYKIENVKETEE